MTLITTIFIWIWELKCAAWLNFSDILLLYLFIYYKGEISQVFLLCESIFSVFLFLFVCFFVVFFCSHLNSQQKNWVRKRKEKSGTDENFNLNVHILLLFSIFSAFNLFINVGSAADSVEKVKAAAIIL